VPQMEIAMTDSAVGELSEREASYLDHRRQAKAQGMSLAEHCRRHGLNVKAYYQIARDLADRRRMLSGRKVQPAAAFAPVRITPAAVSSATTMCRIKHPSGWVIECAALPPPSWLKALTGTQHT
jgi:hypothetical protein